MFPMGEKFPEGGAVEAAEQSQQQFVFAQPEREISGAVVIPVQCVHFICPAVPALLHLIAVEHFMDDLRGQNGNIQLALDLPYGDRFSVIRNGGVGAEGVRLFDIGAGKKARFVVI